MTTRNDCEDLCSFDGRFMNTINQYTFFFHIQKYYNLSLFELQKEYLLSKSKTSNPMVFLLTSVECKEKKIPIQQFPELKERFFVYSSSDRTFFQFQYAFSYNQYSSHHISVKDVFIINGFGGYS